LFCCLIQEGQAGLGIKFYFISFEPEIKGQDEPECQRPNAVVLDPALRHQGISWALQP
jgi:hypothetical protein